ncbi:MAG: ribokinase [Megamonas funiformis]|uniref:ribokinase n=1 Tax=Megamonas funiformis TaxID=437897 RepID=UPI002A7FC017|nr:ribokinase [Megamonas funiformis]MDY3873673.1 ribokinase [Megamonas funiformis]
MKILNFGSLNIDKVYAVEEIVKGGETIDSVSFNESVGGKGLNQSIAVAKAGGNIMHAGCVGKDGEILLQALKDNNVDTSLIKTVETASGQAIIQVDKHGQNCIILFHGANYEVDKAYIDEAMQDFAQGDILILQNEISNIDYIIEVAKTKQMKIYLNPSPINENLNKYNMQAIDGIFVNEHEGAYLAGKEKVEDILDSLASKYPELEIILTFGDKGAYYRHKDINIFQPAYKVDAVDTTAAGDTFTGYFIALRQQGKSIEESLQKASKASSITVSRKGASISIPKIAEVD